MDGYIRIYELDKEKNNLEKNENRDKKKRNKDKKKMQSEDVARSQSVGGEGGAPC